MADETLREITKDDVEGLPPRAIVAFAARCARRVQPLFDPERGLGEEDHQAAEGAIAFAEACGAATDLANSSESARSVEHQIFAVIHGQGSAFESVGVVFNSAASSVISAYNVLASAPGLDPSVAGIRELLENAAFIAERSESAVAAALSAHAARFSAVAIRHDLDLLLACSAEQGWTEDSDVVVPPEFFGPMWPDGEPGGWPETQYVPVDGAPPIRMVIDPGEASEETIRGVYAALNDLFVAHGGGKLRFDDDGTFEIVKERVEVCE